MTRAAMITFAWKAYTILVIGSQLLITALNHISVTELLSLAVALALCLPLITYAWQRPIGPRWLGKFAFLLGVAVVPVSSIWLAYKLGTTGVVMAIALLLFFAPYFYASFVVGYRVGAGRHWAAPNQGADRA